MIIGFSTSSPWASVAVVDRKLGLLWHGAMHAPHASSGACIALLERMAEETEHRLEDAEWFAADTGPGSFTGVRVGVTLAKTFGFLYGKPVAGANSFDLISSEKTVALPSKKGEFFVRRPGEPPVRSVQLPEEPFVGFGGEIEPEVYPDAVRFAALAHRLQPVEAILFVPEYLIEPNISTPKKPFVFHGGGAARSD